MIITHMQLHVTCTHRNCFIASCGEISSFCGLKVTRVRPQEKVRYHFSIIYNVNYPKGLSRGVDLH